MIILMSFDLLRKHCTNQHFAIYKPKQINFIYLPVENELCQYRKQFLDLFDKLGVKFFEDLTLIYDEVIKYNPPFTWSVRQSGPYVGCH